MERFLDFQFKKETKLLPLFFSESFRSVAVTLLSFFSSIFVFKKVLAISDKEKLAFLAVFGFFLILYLAKIMGTSLAENFSLRWGLKKQVYLGHFLTGLTFLAFLASEKIFVLLWLAPILWGLAIGFFWFGRHGLLTKIGTKGGYGRALGWASVVNTVLLLGVPFFGGVLVTQLGYRVLFLASFVFVALGFLTLVPVGEQKTHRDVTLKEVIKLLSTHKRMTLTYFGMGAASAIYSAALILYIFLLLKKEMILGGFFSLSMVIVALANFLTGSWVDKRGKQALIAYGSLFSALIWLGRLAVVGIVVLFIFDVVDRIAGGMLGIPLDVLSYEKALDGQSTGRALLFREIALTIGSIFSCGLLIVLTLLGMRLQFSFLSAALFSLLPLLIVRQQ